MKRKLIILTAIALICCAGACDLNAQAARTNKKNSTKRPATTAAPAPSAQAATTAPERGESQFDLFMMALLKNSFVLIRQDYQLVDQEEGEIKEVEGRDYWGRGYSLGVRIGDSEYLITGDAMRPWSKESIARNSRYQPELSQTAYRDLGSSEFEPLDFSADAATELCENRIYTTSGSEEPGLSVLGTTGATAGYAAWVVPETPIKDGADLQKLTLKVAPMSTRLSDTRHIYDCNLNIDDSAIGGVYLVPVTLHPGCVDFCVAGMLQRIGGIWKLVSIPEGVDVMAPADSSQNGGLLMEVINGMNSEMQSFLNTIGL